jgi:hypothetical protein
LIGNKVVTTDADGRPRDWLGNHAAAFIGGEYTDQPDKGEAAGSCYMQACQRPRAVHRNDNNRGKYYCRECAYRLNRANTGIGSWKDVLLDREALETYDATLKVA